MRTEVRLSTRTFQDFGLVPGIDRACTHVICADKARKSPRRSIIINHRVGRVCLKGAKILFFTHGWRLLVAGAIDQSRFSKETK